MSDDPYPHHHPFMIGAVALTFVFVLFAGAALTTKTLATVYAWADRHRVGEHIHSIETRICDWATRPWGAK